MYIANPIYDTVFKHLMENERIARFFIETIIGMPIESISVSQQERTLFTLPASILIPETETTNKNKPLSVIRYDFLATIRTPDGYKKVLIEIQKAKNELDMARFRTYVGEQYRRKDKIIVDGKETEDYLPIITIYLLGFKLPGTDAIVIHVSRTYKDVIGCRDLEIKSEFIECLTHDSFVVQIPRIEGKTRSRLEKMLNVFEQKYFYDDTKILKQFLYDEHDEEIREMLHVLSLVGADPEKREEIELERRSSDFLENYLKLNQDLAQTKQALAQKNQALAQKDINTVINAHKAGLPIDTIVAITGLPTEDIVKIINNI